jgi:hypothetical protein
MKRKGLTAIDLSRRPLEAMTACLEDLSDVELRRLCMLPTEVTETNCWYLIYHAAETLALQSQALLEFRMGVARAQETRFRVTLTLSRIERQLEDKFE